MKHLALTLITGSTVLFAACQKKDETPAQPDKITIDLTSPKDGQVYKKGDTINILASISYLTKLHGYQLSIKNKMSGAVVFDAYEHVHTDRFDVNTFWIDSLSAPSELLLQLTVEIDHEGNQSTKEITVHNQL